MIELSGILQWILYFVCGFCFHLNCQIWSVYCIRILKSLIDCRIHILCHFLNVPKVANLSEFLFRRWRFSQNWTAYVVSNF